jgi:hypothetical protein
MDVGVGTSGQGENPQVMMRRSNDYGQTWSQEQWRPLGKQGEYAKRVRWDGEGSARGRVYEVSGTDPVITGITDAFCDFSQPVRALANIRQGPRA